MNTTDLQTMLREYRNAQCARKMALTAMQLLNINPDAHQVALLIGYSSSMDNLHALIDWIERLVDGEAEASDFRNWVYPELVKHLHECQQQYQDDR